MVTTATWIGTQAWLAWMRSLVQSAPERGVQSVGKTAIEMQTRIKDNLEAAVYAQPNKRGYVRTRTLFRSVNAAPPDADRSGDEERAHSGEDLAVDSSGRAAAVQSDGKIASTIGSHVRYSEAVQEGANGVPPRPYITDSDVDEAARLLGDQFEKDISIVLGGS